MDSKGKEESITSNKEETKIKETYKMKTITKTIIITVLGLLFIVGSFFGGYKKGISNGVEQVTGAIHQGNTYNVNDYIKIKGEIRLRKPGE